METGRSPRAITILLILLITTLGFATAAPVAAQTPPGTDDPASAAAGWLARQLVDGERFESVYGGVTYPDAGLTADAVLAFDAADVAQDFARRATAWLATEAIMNSYLGYEFDASFAGSHAKLALVAMAQGENPRAFGGIDLIAALRDLQVPSGRLSDLPTDYSSNISQSLGVLALVRAGEDATAAAGFLAANQCADGGFAFAIGVTPCASEPDATGFAVQALLAAGLDEAAGRALDYLESAQRDGGGFGGIGPTEPTNANSTAIAAQALRSGGRDDAADAAIGYLATLQVGCDGPADERGAVAYDTNGVADSAPRATAQAVTALAGIALIDIDNDGDQAAAPVLACAPQPSPTTSEAPTVPTLPGQPSTGPAPQPGAGPDLPATGAPVGPSLWVGALLLLTGAALVLVARRRPSTGDR